MRRLTEANAAVAKNDIETTRTIRSTSTAGKRKRKRNGTRKQNAMETGAEIAGGVTHTRKISMTERVTKKVVGGDLQRVCNIVKC